MRIHPETKTAMMPICYGIALNMMWNESECFYDAKRILDPDDHNSAISAMLAELEKTCLETACLWPDSGHVLNDTRVSGDIIRAFDKMKKGVFKNGHEFHIFVSFVTMMFSDWLDERRGKMKQRHSDKLKAMESCLELLLSIYYQCVGDKDGNGDFFGVDVGIGTAKQAATELLMVKGW